MLCILGSIVIIIHSPKDQDVNSVEELEQKIMQSGKYKFIYVELLDKIILFLRMGMSFVLGFSLLLNISCATCENPVHN